MHSFIIVGCIYCSMEAQQATNDDGYTVDELRDMQLRIDDMLTDAAKNDNDDLYKSLRSKLWTIESEISELEQ